jgi:hypothetical protein
VRARLDPAACDARRDVPQAQSHTDKAEVVCLVCVRLGRPPARPAPRSLHGRDGVDEWERLVRVVDVRSGQDLGEGVACAIDDDVMLRALFPAIRGVRSGMGPPFTARTLPESNAARLQSMSPRRPRSSSRTRWRRAKTPARVQLRSRCQHVTPLQPKTSAGRSCQAMPVLRTKMTPRRQARSSRRGRPRRGRRPRRSRGSSGATRSHRPSGTSSRLMPRSVGHAEQHVTSPAPIFETSSK